MLELNTAPWEFLLFVIVTMVAGIILAKVGSFILGKRREAIEKPHKFDTSKQ